MAAISQFAHDQRVRSIKVDWSKVSFQGSLKSSRKVVPWTKVLFAVCHLLHQSWRTMYAFVCASFHLHTREVYSVVKSWHWQNFYVIFPFHTYTYLYPLEQWTFFLSDMFNAERPFVLIPFKAPAGCLFVNAFFREFNSFFIYRWEDTQLFRLQICNIIPSISFLILSIWPCILILSFESLFQFDMLYLIALYSFFWLKANIFYGVLNFLKLRKT